MIHLLASAGTYIKEFIHGFYFKLNFLTVIGDLERTKPNLGMHLNTPADIIQLDVIKLYSGNLTEDIVKDFKNFVCKKEKII